MPLFDDIPRPDADVFGQHEAAFAYLRLGKIMVRNAEVRTMLKVEVVGEARQRFASGEFPRAYFYLRGKKDKNPSESDIRQFQDLLMKLWKDGDAALV